MKLSEILKNVCLTEARGNLEKDITGVSIDSRKVRPGDLFVAVKGTLTDGHEYISKAIEKGAAAVLVSGPVSAEAPEGVTFVRVADTEAVAGEAATAFFGRPTERLRLVGVTGTNGKTTVATLLLSLIHI